MRTKTFLALLLAVLVLGLAACSSDDSTGPADPQDPGDGGDGVLADVSFVDYGAAARQVLPPVYANTALKVADPWKDGDYALLGKVFADDEPMSIHRNIDDFDGTMQMIEEMLADIAEYEAEHGEIPNEPLAFDDPEDGTGTMTVHFQEATAPIPVPAVCQTVFGRDEVVVDHLLRVEVTRDQGEDFSSPYLGFSASETAQTVYYWDINRDETGQANGSQLLWATKDITSDAFEIAGATFQPDGPGDEARCNWAYHLTGNQAYEFTYNMGWYSENPEFQLFGCIQGSGDKDTEFGLRYHQYTDTSGWDTIDEYGATEEIFGPIGDDPYAYIDEPDRAGTIADYVDSTVMYVRDDSPLAEIPNPFLAFFE